MPWCGLGTWPTPLEEAGALARACGLDTLWLKREDRSAPEGGGNKVRSLEFLFARAPGATVFVTVGATGSTHCLATAVHAVPFRGAVLAQFPQPETEASAAVAAATRRVARRIIFTPRAALPVAVLRAWIAARAFGQPRWVPAGGASPRGVVGQLLGGCELARDLRGAPDAIVVPLGTGGTAAGLALAIAVLGWPTRVVAARVAPRVVANGWRVRALMRGAARLLARYGIDIPAGARPLVVDALGAGYGAPSAAGEAARLTAAGAGLALDPTYGAKAFGVLSTLAARGVRRVVFWHTFALPHPAADLATPSTSRHHT